jgi:hypothetical protein
MFRDSERMAIDSENPFNSSVKGMLWLELAGVPEAWQVG